METLIGTAPEVLVPHLAAHTSKIRLGAGGVMLSYLNPYHVAEHFQLINHLADVLKISLGTDNPSDLFLLGGSVSSALFAAEENVYYKFTHFVNNDVSLLNEVTENYKENVQKGKFIVALSVLVVEDEEMLMAIKLSRCVTIFRQVHNYV